MQANLAVTFLPIVNDEKKVDVSVNDDQAVIKLSTWTEGLGWCGQKTLALDAEMLDELHRAIAAARIRLKRQSGEVTSDASRVLEFPRVS